MLLPILLFAFIFIFIFFLAIAVDPYHQTVWLISVVGRPSALSRAPMKTSARMFAQLWRLGLLHGCHLESVAGPHDNQWGSALPCRSPCHTASIGSSFCVRTNFPRLHKVLEQPGAKTIWHRHCEVSIAPEGTFTCFWSLNLKTSRFLRTKQRKAPPSHMQLLVSQGITTNPRKRGGRHHMPCSGLPHVPTVWRAPVLPPKSHSWWLGSYFVMWESGRHQIWATWGKAS